MNNRDKNGRFLKGFRHSEFSKRKIVDGLKNRPVSTETRLKIKVSNTGKVKKPHTTEWKRNMSVILTGKKRSLETRTKISVSKKGIDNGRTLCVNCHKKTLSYGFHPKI